MTTAPKPPKGRRWLIEGEIIRKRDWYHYDGDPFNHKVTINEWARNAYVGEYSRAIPRKTTRKQLK